MRPSLRQETERLARSWMQHDAAHLRDYLVAGVEDPRINLQSMLSRHFLVRAISGERLGALMEQEGRFSAVMNWLLKLAGRAGDTEQLDAVLYALRHRADNAEGVEIPRFVGQAFSRLPVTIGGLTIANYIASCLSRTEIADGQTRLDSVSLDTFCWLWNTALGAWDPSTPGPRPSLLGARPAVLEPACGSANDYRFLDAYGIARHLEYTGFDLCPRNIENARGLFRGVRFELGNVFEIAAPDKEFDFCIVHDLFEHLSPEGLSTAVREVCRVTRQGLCIGFFNMDEISEHVVRRVDEYYWNRLSMARIRESFAGHGFQAQVIHIGTFLRQIGCEETHNPNAYTFILRPLP